MAADLAYVESEISPASYPLDSASDTHCKDMEMERRVVFPCPLYPVLMALCGEQVDIQILLQSVILMKET